MMRNCYGLSVLVAAVAGMAATHAHAAIVIGFNNPSGAENPRQVYAYDTTGDYGSLSFTNTRLILNIGDSISINGLGVGELDGNSANGDEIGVQFIGSDFENAYAYNYNGTTSAGREIYTFGALPLAGFDIGDALNEGSNRFIFGENVAGNSGDPDGATDFYIRQWNGTSVGDSKSFGFGITLATSGAGVGNVDGNAGNGNEIVVAFNDRNGDGVLGDVGVFGYRLDPAATVNGLGAIISFDFTDRLLSDIAVGDIDPQNNNGNELLVAFNTPEGSELYAYKWNGTDPAVGQFVGAFGGGIKIGGLGIGNVVPEPASLALFMLPAAMLMRRRTR